MAAIGDDCYFFCTSTCAKGAACPFRHVESAKTNKIICQHWQTNGCLRPMCKFRHSDFHIQVNYSEIPCYWESQPVGCHKANCVYKHSKPRPDFSKTAATQAKPNSPEQKNGTDQTGEGKEVVDKFVMPTVKPVIIDPESEASNSSPVKKPPPKDTTEDASEEGKETHRETKSSDLKKDNGKGEEKKSAKVVGKKKKAGVLTPKNSKFGTVAAKGVKKVKKNVNGSPTTKVPVKRKMNTIDAKPAVPAKIKAKDRLGVKPTIGANGQKKKEEQSDEDESSSSSSSDSDDSIENVKVLSMEEIFRQKALESMMKKRAAEGKPMLPEYDSSKKKTAVVKSQPSKSSIVDRRPKRPVIADNRPKKQVLVKKRPPTPPPPQESESEEVEDDDDEEEEEEEEETNEEEVKEDGEVEEAESSTSESESSSSSSSESEVRRVVINLDAEKTAREKAKESLAKKRRVGVAASDKTLKKRKVVREEPLSLSRNVASSVHQRLSIKERLGVPTSVARREVKKKVPSSSEEESDENDRDERFSDVKVKSVKELQKEKLNRLGNSPIKDRLGPSKTSDAEDEQDEKTARQILLSEDVPSSKKDRRRPWSSSSRQHKTKPVHQEEVGEEDQRTVSATSFDDKEPVEKIQIDEPESPFEILRRGALLKKTQLQENVVTEIKDDDEPESPFESLRRRALLKKSQPQENVVMEIKDDESEEAEEVSGKRKKHKHKHKHKKHKKSKSERQIYVPPPKKSVITEVLERVKKVSSLLPQQDDIPEYQEDSIVNKPTSSILTMGTSVQPRPRPRAAAMWAAGLSVSSKGLSGRPLLKVESEHHDGDVDNINVNVPLQKPFTTSKFQTSTSTLSSTSAKESRSSVPVVKTFSQIMAEKRQKRQQAQASGVGEDDSLSSSPSRMSSSPSRISSKTDSSRPRVPITPIRYDHDAETKVNQPPRTRPSTTSIFNREGSSQSPPPARTTTSAIAVQSPFNLNSVSSSPGSSKSSSTVPLSDIRPTYKTARAKKLFNKKAAKAPSQSSQTSVSTISTSDSPTHIAPSSVSVDTTSSSSSSSSTNRHQHHHHHHHHHHRKSIEKTSEPVPAGDGVVALKSPTADVKKHRRVSTASEANPKHSTSMDDEFAMFDGGDDIEDIGDIIGKDVEPIDDLLQDIDDLLA